MSSSNPLLVDQTRPRADLGHPWWTRETRVRQSDTVARGSELAQCDVFGGLTDLKGSPDPLELLI
ncbi:MAG: hypothetical protein ACI8Y4_004383 [Candidatus Poriferisodalaceae bacterium]|jgi:hypothetical protein